MEGRDRRFADCAGVNLLERGYPKFVLKERKKICTQLHGKYLHRRDFGIPKWFPRLLGAMSENRSQYISFLFYSAVRRRFFARQFSEERGKWGTSNLQQAPIFPWEGKLMYIVFSLPSTDTAKASQITSW